MPDEVVPLSESALADEIEFLAIKLFSAGTRRANEALRHLDLRVRLYSVLSLACSGSRPSQRDLAEFLALDPSQIVALVTELEERGLVTRETDLNDRRSKAVLATDAGAALFHSAKVATSRAEAETLTILTNEERASLRALLRKVVFPPGEQSDAPRGRG